MSSQTSEQTATHSPLPWRIDSLCKSPHVEIWDAEINGQTHQIAEVFRYPPRDGPGNADFIVRAVNSHQQLVDALKAEQEWRDREEAGALDPEWDYEMLVGDKRRSALAAAEGSK